MNKQKETTGVILAGGLARRMAGNDKGLQIFNGRPLVEYAIDAMNGNAEQIIINANRNADLYRRYGYDIVPDLSNDFAGPLAGILAAMSYASTDVLLVLPCDSPFFKREHVSRLLAAMSETAVDAAVALDGQRIQPVFAALRTDLADNLCGYLAEGGRKLETWLEQHRLNLVDFSATPEIFTNLNSFDDMTRLGD